ncbi:DUF6445 family protein [Thalassotalea atypica]|uniref:DUF6445 family protein n=1 Tax=Thalassotalea atypica TaxID=2054316 RepID=UPI0025741B3E|nr:DUF6445 family protein [Thalassotalea atypica]
MFRRQGNAIAIEIGEENTPIIVLDNACENLDELLLDAYTKDDFTSQESDFYPGVRRPAPADYQQQLSAWLLPLLTLHYDSSALSDKTECKAKTMLSTYAIATTAPDKLRPIQTLPHFDTAADNQFAVVHYLCDESHGGTSFYRHKILGYERIFADRLAKYGGLLKQQAISEKLHLTPRYMQGSTSLFERIHTVVAKMNRMVIYPSNLLHSGNINTNLGLSDDPQHGRLTISSFVTVSAFNAIKN